jgi:hypothetical protein
MCPGAERLDLAPGATDRRERAVEWLLFQSRLQEHSKRAPLTRPVARSPLEERLQAFLPEMQAENAALFEKMRKGTAVAVDTDFSTADAPEDECDVPTVEVLLVTASALAQDTVEAAAPQRLVQVLGQGDAEQCLMTGEQPRATPVEAPVGKAPHPGAASRMRKANRHDEP